jgi:hypothetical protein
MEMNWSIGLNENERAMVMQINKMFSFEFPENTLLEYTLISVKLEGAAYLHDIMNISSLGIPIFQLLAQSREQSLSDLIKHLKVSSINVYEFKRTLESFLISK